MTSLYQYCLMGCDVLSYYHNYVLIVQFAMLTTMILIINIYHYFVITFVNSRLRLISSYCSHQTNNQLFPNANSLKTFSINKTLLMTSALKRIYQIHFNLCNYYNFTYGKLWALAMFAFIICSLPFNVMSILSLNNRTLIIQHIIIITLQIALHASVLLIILITMAWQTETLHRSKKFLVPIVQWINMRTNWRLKLQYCNWYNRITYGPKYGPFITIIGHINYHTVMNVSQFYNAI